ncbi:MAG: hypothetical protein AAB316_24560 [Bacteroidota bacterium]
MKSIQNGFEISGFPLEPLEKFEDLLYFEGAVLTHMYDETGNDYFAYWVDEDESGYRWLFFRVEKEDIFFYLSGKKSLRELLTTSKNPFIIAADVSGKEYRNVTLLKPKDLDESYLPEAESYFALPVPEKYNALFPALRKDRSLVLNQ